MSSSKTRVWIIFGSILAAVLITAACFAGYSHVKLGKSSGTEVAHSGESTPADSTKTAESISATPEVKVIFSSPDFTVTHNDDFYTIRSGIEHVKNIFGKPGRSALYVFFDHENTKYDGVHPLHENHQKMFQSLQTFAEAFKCGNASRKLYCEKVSVYGAKVRITYAANDNDVDKINVKKLATSVLGNLLSEFVTYHCKSAPDFTFAAVIESDSIDIDKAVKAMSKDGEFSTE